MKILFILCFALIAAATTNAQEGDYEAKAHYTKHEYYIPMRDGVKLFTAVYTPKDKSGSYPFIMKRTPYSVRPYGVNNFPEYMGPVSADHHYEKEGYIFVNQDGRGRWMSEGGYEEMSPHNPDKQSNMDTDESTDTYDTVEWLLENVAGNNGRVGIWGISYPGFYTSASIIDSHPAIKAATPQAPMGDMFIGDDDHHNGAFFLLDSFRFYSSWRVDHDNPTKSNAPRIPIPHDDAYRFFLELGALHNVNDKYFHGRSPFWNSLMEHGNYDEFWQKRNIIPNMNGVKTNVLTVLGSFDAEDSYGGTKIYNHIEENNSGINNMLVRGPWYHGGWVRSEGNYLGNVPFDQKTSGHYQKNIEHKFFDYYLKDKGEMDLPEITTYYSGSNEWREHDQWPPAAAEPFKMYLTGHNGISTEVPVGEGSDEYVSDPANPVPFTRAITNGRSREYMVEDQRFASRRPDVMTYQTEILSEDVTLAGPVVSDLFVSLTGTDADFVVKVIDVFPDDFPEHEEKHMDVPMKGYQMMVRGDIFRGKYRNSFENPEGFEPGEVTNVNFTMPDISHTFKQGHRIMIQVQSSWFPLADRNPQQFMDIYSARDEDYIKATHTIHRSNDYPSSVTIPRIPN
ncbi:MAG: CocE/NonD family hydrolase [Kordiimonadaceae bacterium]|jgi:uncharacterized protein|nr:CocE/NonD family hydrolase [Kordiimonadaceae bacterium]